MMTHLATRTDLRRAAGAACCSGLLLLALALGRAEAQSAATGAKGGGLSASSLGGTTVDATSSRFQGGFFVYTDAHAVTDSGATMDADDLRINLARTKELPADSVVATGHVRAHLKDADNPAEPYDVTATAKKAVYDPTTQRINLSGDVRTVVLSHYTVGPLVQTGQTAYIQLGSGPDYPQIVMNQVHTTFTPVQQQPVAAAPAPAATH